MRMYERWLAHLTFLRRQDALESPANSELLAKLYQALLIGAMEATKDANHNAIVPSVCAWMRVLWVHACM